MVGFKTRCLVGASSSALALALSLAFASTAAAQTPTPPVTRAEAPAAQQAPVSDAPGVADPQQPAGDAPVSPGDVARPVENGTAVSEVVVTGTRLRGVAPVGSSIVAVGRQDIALSSGVTTTQILQEIPQIFNLGITDATRGGNGGAGNITFGSSINIRGIGPNATLTIVNGHRVSPQGTTGAAPDPSVIPTVMLERVEIVPDGASAIYGSDAIAGVANLIMRRNVEGVEVQAYYGSGDSYNERNLSIIGGYRWATGQITASIEQGFRSRLPGPSRDFFRSDLRNEGGTDFRVTNCVPGNIVIGTTSYAIPASGATPTNLIAGTSNRCDNIRNQDILPEQDRISAAFTFDQQVGSEARFYADGFYSRREFSRRVPMAAQVLTVPRTNAFFVAPSGLTPATEQVQYSFANDFGPYSTTTGFSETFTLAAGMEFTLPYDWRLNVGGNYGRTDELADAEFGINQAALTAALASSNPATAFNPFGTTANSASVLAPINNNINLAPGENEQWVMEASLGGPVFRLPGGEVRLAVGLEYVSLDLSGGQVQGARAAPAARYGRADRQVRSAYAELLVPLVGEDNALPGIRRLDVDIAGRIDEYSDFGTTRNPKIGVNYSPFEGLTLRANYGTSFRAPGLSQLVTINATPGIFLQNYSDPLANNGAGGITQGVAINGPNPNLGPETATTWSIGGEYSPPQIPGLRLSLNYFDIDYENQIVGYLSNLTLLQNEAAYSSVIIRNPTQAFLQSLINEGRVVNGGSVANVLASRLFVDGRGFNQATTLARGFDFTALYRMHTDSWGDFTAGFNGTYFIDYITAPTSAAAQTQQVNLINNPPQFRGRGSLSWRYGDFFAIGWLNYYNSYTNNLSGTSVREVDAYTTIDFRLSYTLGEGFPTWAQDTTISLDGRNLFDQEPPFVNIAPSANGGGGFDPQASNPVGRVIGVSLSHRF